MKTCEDCGCTLRNGICTNCEEELFIYDYQMDDWSLELSEEFKNKVKEQRKKHNEKQIYS